MERQVTYQLWPGTEVLAQEPGHLFYSPLNHKWVLVNEDGRRILDLLQDEITIDQLVAECSAYFFVSANASRPVIETFVEEQVENGIVQMSGNAGRPDWGSVLSAPTLEQVYLEVTDRCNLRCRYCYNSQERKRSRTGRAPYLAKEDYLALIADLLAMGVSGFVLSGGEPLLCPWIWDIAEACKLGKARTTLLTNATLVTDQMADRIVRAFDRVEVSLDSSVEEENDATRGAGTHRRVIRGIKRLVGAGHKAVVVKPVLSTHNVHSIAELPLFVKNVLRCYVHSPSIALPFESDNGSMDTSLTPHYELANEALADFASAHYHCYKGEPKEVLPLGPFLSCGVGKRILCIDSRGRVYPCQAMHNEKMLCGHLQQQSISEIYETSAVLRGLSELWVFDVEKCRECKWVLLCGGGCRALAMQLHGRVDAHIEELCSFMLENGKRTLVEAACRELSQDRPANLQGRGRHENGRERY
ncbi:MAG: radical SAM protein [Thermodesulfobacteriota bacterium]